MCKDKCNFYLSLYEVCVIQSIFYRIGLHFIIIHYSSHTFDS